MINDLRDWIQEVEQLGDLKRVNGAHWDGEIGEIVDLYQRRMGLPGDVIDEGPFGEWTGYYAGGGRFLQTIAIQQLYPGHARQVGLVASQVHAAAYANRYVIVVDEDIDPTDINQVIWALCTRVDPKEDVEIVKRCWSTALDPMSYPERERVFNSRMIIDACRPWERRKDFPAVCRASEAMVRRVQEKWPELFR